MTKKLSPDDLITITSSTLKHYGSHAESFWLGTKDHDVSQNYAALLEALPQRTGLRILDFGCGPGRDLMYFKSMGHLPTGLDGSAAFCEMARSHSGCPVLHQNFLELNLGKNAYDGVFANASLFHVPKQELVSVLMALRDALVPQGILFSSNPRGSDEGWSGERYGAYMESQEYTRLLQAAGFSVLNHYYRPQGLPRDQQPWLAVVSQSTKADAG